MKNEYVIAFKICGITFSTNKRRAKQKGRAYKFDDPNWVVVPHEFGTRFPAKVKYLIQGVAKRMK
jgi:hypothetical protein